MKTKWLFWVSIVALCALPACGDDDDDDDNGRGGSGGGTSGSGGSGGGTSGTGGGSSGSGGGTSGSGGSSGGGTITDACTNASDAAAIQATYGGGMAGAGGAGQTYSEVVAECGLGCISENGSDDVQLLITCTEECVGERTDNAVSATCTQCFTQSALCAFNNCIARCAVDPASEGCLACRCNAPDSGNMGDVNCEAQFAECSGVDRMVCEG